MKRLFPWLGVVVCAAAVLLPASLQASNFVFTDNSIFGFNSVTAFSVDSTTGALTKLGTTRTGGAGCGDGFAASNRIITSPDGKYLYVSNEGSNDITIFRVNESTGALSAVGPPVATGGTLACGPSISLAITPNGDFLAATVGSQNIRIFSVATNGGLSPVGGLVSLPGEPDGIKVRPDGKFLAVAVVNLLYHDKVAMFGIGPMGALTAVRESPFPARGSGGEAGVDFNCGGDLLFGGEANSTATILDVFRVGPEGALSPVPGSPFTIGFGTINSNVVLWNPFGHMLFVSNQLSSSVIDFIVGPTGALRPGANQPVSLGVAYPEGMAVNTIQTPTGRTVTLLYVADLSYSRVFVFTVESDGTLIAVPGSPFRTGEGEYSGLKSLAVDPPGVCQ